MNSVLFSQLQTAYYFKAAELTLFLCEYLQTFDREVKYMWGSRWNLTKVLFYLARYTPFVDLTVKIIIVKIPVPSVKACTALLNIEMYVTSLGMGGAQVFFCVRAYALWGPSRAAYNFLFMISLSIVAFGIFIPILINNRTEGLKSNILQGCAYGQSTAATLIFPLVAAVYSAVLDILLMIMILWARRKRSQEGESRLMQKIYLDALGYFGVQLATHIISIILWLVFPGPLKDIPPALPRVMICIVTMRVILHLRELAAEDVNWEDTCVPLSPMEFQANNRHGVTALQERTL